MESRSPQPMNKSSKSGRKRNKENEIKGSLAVIGRSPLATYHQDLSGVFNAASLETVKDTGHSNGSQNNTCRKRNWLTFDEGNSRGPGTALDAFLKKRVETMNHGGMKQPSPVLLNHATERSPLSVIDCYSNQFPVVTSQSISKEGSPFSIINRSPNQKRALTRHSSSKETKRIVRGLNVETLMKRPVNCENVPINTLPTSTSSTLTSGQQVLNSSERSPLTHINTTSRSGFVRTSSLTTKGVRHRGPNLETLFKDRGSVENTPVSDNKGSANPAETPDIVLPSSTNPKQSVSKRPAQEESETENAAKKSDPNESAYGASGTPQLSVSYRHCLTEKVQS